MEEQNEQEFDFSRIEDVRIDLRAELGKKSVTFGSLLNLDVGSILPLGRPTGENVDLLAGDVRIGSGEILIIESVLAVRVADLNDPDAEDKVSMQLQRS